VRHLDAASGGPAGTELRGCSLLRLRSCAFRLNRMPDLSACRHGDEPQAFTSCTSKPCRARNHDEAADSFILPAPFLRTLGVGLGALRVPPNITVICLCKSNLCPPGDHRNTTPAEWRGHWRGNLTLEVQ